MRFNYLVEPGNDLPGPGDYQLYKQNLWRDNKESGSRLGYGGFVTTMTHGSSQSKQWRARHKSK